MKKGISMISLSISLIVIVVLTSAIVISSKPARENSNRTKFVAEVLLIQDGIESYRIKHGTYPEDGIISMDLSNVSEDAKVQFEGEQIEENQISLYLINFEKIGIKDKEFGNNDDGQNLDVYAFSKETNKVYYIKGIKYEGNIYYTLTEKLYKNTMIQTLNQNEVKKEDCIFVRTSEGKNINSDEYVMGKVDVNIYIPKSAENINITYSNYVGNAPGSEVVNSDKQGYIKYKTICDTATNYTIKITYTLNNIEKQVEYVENKVDILAPTIDLSNMQIITLSGDGETKKYLTGYDILDNESGVKLKKYELGKVALEYFSDKRGKDISENNIDVTGQEYLTIYAEDNIGNKVKVVINLQNGNVE